MTFQIQACLLACWAMRERDVVVCNIIEEVNFRFVQHQARRYGMHRSVTPPLVEESTI